MLSSDSVRDEAVIQALHQTYGILTDFSALDSLEASPPKVSSATHFNFKGRGFTPGGQVFIAFGLPGSADISAQIVTADANGRIKGKFQLPQLASGIYLLSAIDMKTVNNSLLAMKTSGTINRPLTHIGSVLIEVKAKEKKEK